MVCFLLWSLGYTIIGGGSNSCRFLLTWLNLYWNWRWHALVQWVWSSGFLYLFWDLPGSFNLAWRNLRNLNYCFRIFKGGCFLETGISLQGLSFVRHIVWGENHTSSTGGVHLIEHGIRLALLHGCCLITGWRWIQMTLLSLHTLLPHEFTTGLFLLFLSGLRLGCSYNWHSTQISLRPEQTLLVSFHVCICTDNRGYVLSVLLQCLLKGIFAEDH